MRTWRRLQQLGAIPIKQAVYLLPDIPSAREDFEWLKTEVKAAGGDASVFAADNVDAWSDDWLIEEFRRSRQDAYTVLARDVEKVLRRATGRRQGSGKRAPAIRRLLDVFRERLTGIETIDFFGSAGRDRVTTLLTRLKEHASGKGVAPIGAKPAASTDARQYQGRLWITRPRPGVDRMSSAWLIRRFIDPQARFGFAADRDAVPEGGLPFDMFGVEFSHQGEGCTFETLCTVFKIQEPAISRIAAIVHDLDLKDNRFGAPEAATVGHVIEGLQFAHADDDTLLTQGIALFDSLYRSFEHSARAAGPRPLAKPRKRSTPAAGSPAQRRRSR
ncbi:MAG: chromate resistance protein ChrB domain-containing protein [Vicinamibacterales bacterium]